MLDKKEENMEIWSKTITVCRELVISNFNSEIDELMTMTGFSRTSSLETGCTRLY